MYRKKKGLAMNCEKLEKIYPLETKIFSLSLLARIRGKNFPPKNRRAKPECY